MSPHAIILLAAMGAAFVARLAYPQAGLRIVAAVMLGSPMLLAIALREVPSAIGLFLVALLAAVGAVAGTSAATFVTRSRAGRIHSASDSDAAQ